MRVRTALRSSANEAPTPGPHVMVTVAKTEWVRWLAEGDLPGEDTTGEWGMRFGSGRGREPSPPKHLKPGDRVYIVAFGFVRGYAPLVRIEQTVHGFSLVRGGGAVACTLRGSDGKPQPISGFQGVRYRFWRDEDEGPFDDWMTHGIDGKAWGDVVRLRGLRADPNLRDRLRARAVGADSTPLFRGMPR